MSVSDPDDEAVLQAVGALLAIRDPQYRAAAFLGVSGHRIDKRFSGLKDAPAIQAAARTEAQALFDHAVKLGVIAK